MWDERYANEEYAYGTEPNTFFKNVIAQQSLGGSILLPAEGEGRNAVYAAKTGLEVSAFDISIEGKNKAMKLAEKEMVRINYEVGEFFNLSLVNKEYDAAALIFAHFPPQIASKYHHKIADLIKPGGLMIIEGFSVGHLALRKLNPEVGGPGHIDMLYSEETIQRDFPNFEIIQLEEAHVELNEGNFHNGMSKVIRFIGKKIG
ncbi:class I SAM-dependent methyltransferase [Maribacter sp. TH_r10]|uniref:Methyltransferase domain-containing protein n=1 Tax=Maribacter luteus TaxID=2594478 RepID=A0A6I2MN43_9FLAO|nr:MULTISPECIES: class I SAM-dependent methyltransferase [Maribacter]MDV7137285.1 class I SAM-dependent methyltransferase [Maribacter sp. TH_r10]MRX63614.1 methyltransferase domain-containing protein [Maribacter luteus]